MARIVTAAELSTLRTQQPDLAVIDVRLAEDFAGEHLPGALNQCVFEVAFLEELLQKGFRKDEPVCVYGASQDSHEARMAAEKLERASFASVLEFRGGLAAWRAAGQAVEGREASPAPAPARNGSQPLDLVESTVVWVGRNLINKHWGHVALAGGQVTFSGGQPRSGEAVLDMRRITCADLAGNELHDVLIHHLESDDFFDVARFPEARFAFDGVEVCSEKPGCRNVKLHGALTLRGVTRPLVIEAAAGFTPEGKAALQASFSIDRTDWGVLYGSGKFFNRLAGHLVNDEIELQLRVLTAEPVCG